MASLTSGIVIITVNAYNLPIKPQTYALAVQVLETPYKMCSRARSLAQAMQGSDKGSEEDFKPQA